MRTDTLSWSQVSTLSSCGQKYKLLYLEEIEKSPQGSLIAGSAVHSTIEWAENESVPARFREGGGLDESNLRAAVGSKFLEIFNRAVEQVGGAEQIRWAGRKTKDYPAGEDDRWWRWQGPVMMRRWLEVRGRDFDRNVKLLEGAVESRVVARLDSGRQVKGYVDATLAVDGDGAPFVRDWKTGRPGGASPMQLAIYAWLIERSTGIAVSAGESGYLRATEIDKRLVHHPDLRPLIDLVPGVFEDHLRRVESGVFEISPSPFCSSCDVAQACPYGRWLTAELVKSI